jgi:hypothetical protein
MKKTKEPHKVEFTTFFQISNTCKFSLEAHDGYLFLTSENAQGASCDILKIDREGIIILCDFVEYGFGVKTNRLQEIVVFNSNLWKIN